MKITSVILLLAVFISFSCGNSTSDASAASAKEPIPAVQNKDGLSLVRIESNDQMRFNLKEIKVKHGNLIELKLVHTGQLNKKIMGHNFVLLKQGTDINDFAKKAMKSKANDYIPSESIDIIAHTKMIGGGEETSISFRAPERGTYPFVCSFPGHVALMNGIFVVE